MRKLVIKDSSPLKEFPVGSGLSIGSQSDCAIQLKGSKVDPQHARLVKTGEHIYIEDLESRYGLTVNGKRVTRWALKADDVIEIAGNALIYQEDDKPEPQPKVLAPVSKATASGSSAKLPAAPGAGSGASRAKIPAVSEGVGQSPSASRIPAVGHSSDSGLATVKSSERSASKSNMAPATGAQSGSGISRARLPAVEPNTAASAKKIQLSGEASGEPRSSAKLPVQSGSSSRFGIPTVSARPGSGVLSAVGDSTSSKRISLGDVAKAIDNRTKSGVLKAQQEPPSSASQAALRAVKDMADDLSRESIKAKSGQRTAAQSGPVWPLLLGIGLVVVVLAGMLIFAFTRQPAEVVKATAEEREAIERLRNKSPKDDRYLRVIGDRIRRAKRWEDIAELLGTPDVTAEGKIPLFSPGSGSYDRLGTNFRGYYLRDTFDSSSNEESSLVSVLLFEVKKDEQLIYHGPQTYVRRPLTPEKQEQAPEKMPTPGQPVPPPGDSATDTSVTAPAPAP